MVYPILHGLLHRNPNLLQIVPNLRTLAQVDIFPIIPAIVVAPVHYLGEAVHIVNFFRRETVRLFSFRERATAYAVDGPVIERVSLPVESFEFHAVRVIWQEYASLPDYFHWSRWFQHLFNGNVGHVALTGRRQAAIKGHLELRCIPVPFEKIFRRPLRPHGMAARRPLANPKKFLERFHATTVIFLPKLVRSGRCTSCGVSSCSHRHTCCGQIPAASLSQMYGNIFSCIQSSSLPP